MGAAPGPGLRVAAAARLLFTLIAFTVYAGGDWIIAYRLVAPARPIADLLVQEGAAEIRDLIRVVPRAKRVAFAPAAVIGVSLS